MARLSFPVVLLVACTSTHNRHTEEDTGTADPREVFDSAEVDILDERDLDEPDIISEPDDPEIPDPCEPNEQPIWIGREYPGCFSEPNLDIYVTVSSIEDELMNVNHSILGDIPIQMLGMMQEDIGHSIDVGNTLRIQLMEYFEGVKCIRGVVISRVCEVEEDIVIVMRDGDLNNPYFPAIPNDEFYTVILPFDISSEEDSCEADFTIPPDCTAQAACIIEIINEVDETVPLTQGQQASIYNGIPSPSTETYKALNNYCYYSEECFGWNQSYVIAREEPATACEL